jgi:fe2+-dicitrate sensor, membrane component
MFNAKVEHRDNRLRTRHRWLRFSAAAVVLTFLSTFTVFHLTKHHGSEQFFTVEAPQGTRSHITLYDGTQVWLNAGSTMSYTSDFNNTSRDIHLSGEAYFEVAYNEKLPFRVKARGCTLTVLGTRFNVSAYDEDPTVQAALIEGSPPLGKAPGRGGGAARR